MIWKDLTAPKKSQAAVGSGAQRSKPHRDYHGGTGQFGQGSGRMDVCPRNTHEILRNRWKTRMLKDMEIGMLPPLLGNSG